MNLKEILKYGKEELIKNNIEDASIIAKELAEHIFKITRAQMIANNDMEFSKDQTDNYINSIKKISTGIPIQYITNNQEFMNLNFYVDENVLIPQPDTETLVEEVINEYKEKKCEILDLCTGSGAIAISLAKYINESNIVASDISMKALQIAKLNAEKNLVRKKIEFIESDMFNKIYKDDFDIIVSNPPYIKTKVIEELDKQVKNEPYIALDGGADGLKFYKIIIENAYKYIKNEGKVFLEIGYDQKNELINLFKKNNHYENIYSKKDLGGNDRIIVATVRR
jgi:release factor glutamine methyltransferase